MTSWQTANDLPGGADTELVALRAEVDRLMGLFREQWAHPASALYFTALALGKPTIPAQMPPTVSLLITGP